MSPVFQSGPPTLQGAIDGAHYWIHQGKSFVATVEADLATAASIIVAFKTPTGLEQLHLLVDFDTEAAAKLEIWRGATWTTNTGSQLPILNRNDNSVIASIALEDTGGSFVASSNLVQDPTGFSTASASRRDVFETWVNKKSGAVFRESDELVLKSDATHAVVLTNNDAAEKGVLLKLKWYEKVGPF